MKKFIFFILLVGLVFSCKKKSTIHITAKNAVTGKPYPGLKYSILRSKTGIFENHYKVVAEGTLDENGEAYITKRFSKNWSHDLSLEHPKNTCYSKKDDYYFSGGENVEADFEYAECGYLKFSIHNVNCQGASDTMILYEKNLNIPDYYLQKGWPFGGCTNYESDYRSDAMGTIEMKWKVTKNNVTNTYYDTIYLDAGEYKTYEINY